MVRPSAARQGPSASRDRQPQRHHSTAAAAQQPVASHAGWRGSSRYGLRRPERAIDSGNHAKSRSCLGLAAHIGCQPASTMGFRPMPFSEIPLSKQIAGSLKTADSLNRAHRSQPAPAKDGRNLHQYPDSAGRAMPHQPAQAPPPPQHNPQTWHAAARR